MNPPNLVDGILGTVGVLGFVLAVVLAIVEFRRYWLKLQLFVQGYRVQYFDEDNQETVVLFRLSFVNPSSVGKTVNWTSYSKQLIVDGKYSTPLGIVWHEPEHLYDMNQKVVYFSLPKIEDYPLPYGELLQYPLDIPPHQSCSRWLLLIGKVGDKCLLRQTIQFEAYDVYEKLVAKRKILLPLNNLKNPGIYSTGRNEYLSPI